METIYIHNKYEMEELAKKMASETKRGDVILLSGTLGVGKTFFAKAFINSLLDKSEEVVSPTFNLLKVYNTKQFDIYHFDLYRMKKVEELYEIGFEDALHDGVCLIEWPELVYDLIDVPYTKIDIEMGEDEDGRVVKISRSDGYLV
jgi:tRNA threonylcarbamoyl adenosine modification protein YjeE